MSPPRIPREEIQPLNAEQARDFLDAVKGDRLEALYHVALAPGLRQGEALALALTWPTVDLDAGTLRVERTLQRYDGAYDLDEVKTARSRRTIAVPAHLADVLRSHRTRQIEERLRAGPDWAGSGWDFVFTTEAGAPIYGPNVTQHFQNALDEAGLPRQRFHDLRHAAASFMLAQGVPVRVAQEVLGHSTIVVTADIYGHVTVDATRAATERVSALLTASS